MNTDITILIVEDDAINSSYLSQVIRKILPCSVIIEAISYDEAIRAISKTRPDLIFMDYYLPGKHGLDIAKEINTLPRHKKIPIVLFTSNAPVKNEAQLSECGICYFLQKPAGIQAISTAVKTCLMQIPTENVNKSNLNHFPENIFHFNKEVFVEKIGNDYAFASMLFSSFVENFATQFESIKNSYIKKDKELYLKNIHHLKGEAGTLCFELLHELLNNLEITAFDNSNESHEILEKITSEFEFIKRNINNFLNVKINLSHK